MSNIRPVQETKYGVYVWNTPDGIVADDDRNFLSISSERGDLVKIDKLTKAVRSYGVTVGEPLFLPGHRKVTDEEYEEQKARLNEGKIPDMYDAGAWLDELNGRER